MYKLGISVLSLYQAEVLKQNLVPALKTSEIKSKDHSNKTKIH